MKRSMWAVTRTLCRSGRSPSKSARSPVHPSASPRVRGRTPATTRSTSQRSVAQVPAFNPQWTVPQGIEEIWKDAHDRGLTTEDFEGPRYVRLQRIQQLAAEGRLDLTDLRLRRNAPRI